MAKVLMEVYPGVNEGGPSRAERCWSVFPSSRGAWEKSAGLVRPHQGFSTDRNVAPYVCNFPDASYRPRQICAVVFSALGFVDLSLLLSAITGEFRAKYFIAHLPARRSKAIWFDRKMGLGRESKRNIRKVFGRGKYQYGYSIIYLQGNIFASRWGFAF